VPRFHSLPQWGEALQQLQAQEARPVALWLPARLLLQAQQRLPQVLQQPPVRQRPLARQWPLERQQPLARQQPPVRQLPPVLQRLLVRQLLQLDLVSGLLSVPWAHAPCRATTSPVLCWLLDTTRQADYRIPSQQ
jgi:hypothetical protein